MANDNNTAISGVRQFANALRELAHRQQSGRIDPCDSVFDRLAAIKQDDDVV